MRGGWGSEAGNRQDAGAEGDRFEARAGEEWYHFVGYKVEFLIVPFVTAVSSAGIQIASGGKGHISEEDAAAGSQVRLQL